MIKARTFELNVWFMRAPEGTEALSANTGKSEFPYVQVTLADLESRTQFVTPNAWGRNMIDGSNVTDVTLDENSSAGFTFFTVDPTYDRRPKQVKGCIQARWNQSSTEKGSVSAYFDLKY